MSAPTHPAPTHPEPARPEPAREVTAAFPIRLIALDIDGTIVDDDLVLGPRTLAAVAAAREQGVAVSLVTGRMTTSASVSGRGMSARSSTEKASPWNSLIPRM